MTPIPTPVLLLGRQPYAATLQAMRDFTAARVRWDGDAAGEGAGAPPTADAIWLVEHEPVFTQGVAGHDAHLLAPGDIPVLRTERGGQVTYHGPGQVVAYPLIDLRRRGYFVKEFVFRIEAALIDLLAEMGVTGHRVRGAPGLYVRLDDPFGHAALPPQATLEGSLRGLGKIAALGIKISRHCSYHGLALNVAMDLEPFARINPCGYAGLRTVDLASLGVRADWTAVAERLGAHLQRRLQP